jgi:S1-C subfamily serine protease
VNVRGEVIGINTAINPTGQGLGFTIPINMARRVAVQLIETGTVRRGYLGILPQELTREIREAWEMPRLAGILVGSVEPRTPAAEGGLEVGDVILDFADEPVENVATFRALVAEAGVGVDVPIRLLRDREEKRLTVVLAERPDTQEPPRRRVRVAEETPLGAVLDDISPDYVESYSLQTEDGVVVTGVSSGGVAARGGLREGDVILEINRAPVRDRRGAEAELHQAREAGKPIVFLVRRGATTAFVSVRLEG